MKLLMCQTPAEELVADLFREWSKPEHGGIENVIVLALTRKGEPVLGALNSSDTSTLSDLLSFAQGYIQGKNEAIENAIFEAIANDFIIEDGSEDYDELGE